MRQQVVERRVEVAVIIFRRDYAFEVVGTELSKAFVVAERSFDEAVNLVVEVGNRPLVSVGWQNVGLLALTDVILVVGAHCFVEVSLKHSQSGRG